MDVRSYDGTRIALGACGGDRLVGAVFAGSGGSAVTFAGFPARGLLGWATGALRSS